MSARIWDISQRIHPDIPVWPGESKVAIWRNATITDDCPVNVGAMSTPLHAGTHADSPLHYDPAGCDSAGAALQPYLGRCDVIDVRHAADRVELRDIDWSSLVDGKRVLFRTFNRFPHHQWVSTFTAISPDVIIRLREMGGILVGTDAPSLDPQDSKTMDAHHEVKAGDMRILEGLVLDDVAPGAYELIALPLRISGADASPVRAILRELA